MSNNRELLFPKVTLRRLATDRDQELTFRWRNDERISKWCRQYDALHFLNHENWFESQASDKSISMYAIQAGSDPIVGVCGLTSIDLINRRAEFSMYIGPEHQGNGYGEAALRALIHKGFYSYGLNSIWGETFDGNHAIKMFKRVGMKLEGTRRESYYRDGRFIDAHLVSILRSEYDHANSSIAV